MPIQRVLVIHFDPKCTRYSAETGYGLISIIVDLKESIQLSDNEDFVDAWIDVRKSKLAILASDLVINRYKRPKGSRGQMIHIFEANEHLGLNSLINKPGYFIAYLLDISLIENVAINKLNANNAIFFCYAK